MEVYQRESHGRRETNRVKRAELLRLPMSSTRPWKKLWWQSTSSYRGIRTYQPSQLIEGSTDHLRQPPGPQSSQSLLPEELLRLHHALPISAHRNQTEPPNGLPLHPSTVTLRLVPDDLCFIHQFLAHASVPCYSFRCWFRVPIAALCDPWGRGVHHIRVVISSVRSV